MSWWSSSWWPSSWWSSSSWWSTTASAVQVRLELVRVRVGVIKIGLGLRVINPESRLLYSFRIPGFSHLHEKYNSLTLTLSLICLTICMQRLPGSGQFYETANLFVTPPITLQSHLPSSGHLATHSHSLQPLLTFGLCKTGKRSTSVNLKSGKVTVRSISQVRSQLGVW